MTEEMVTTPETSTEENLESTPDQDSTNEIKTKGTSEENGQVDFVEELKKSGQIPKGVEPFRDEKGELKFVIPINGKKYIANFKQVLGGFNLNQAGEQKLAQGKELEKKFNSILNNIAASNPEGKKELKKFLTKLGYDLGDLSESLISEVIEEKSMSQEERDYKKRLQEIEAREAKLKDSEKEQEMTKEQKVIFDKQQAFSSEIVQAMKSKKLDDVDGELKKSLMTGIIGEMIMARKNDHNLSADEALDNVLTQYDMLLENLDKLYSREHLKRRLPKTFRDLVMKLSLEDQPDPVSSSIHGGSVEVDESQFEKIKQKQKQRPQQKKINLSEW